jgi:hypothetical protein
MDSLDTSLLLVLNPRELPACLMSLKRLDCPKVWLSYFSEWELCNVISGVVNSTDYKRYVVISDDCIVSQDALEAVLNFQETRELITLSENFVTTGYCNLDVASDLVNLTRVPFRDTRQPDEGSYDWYSAQEVFDSSGGVTSWFAGMALTCMTRGMWQRYPWDCYGKPRGWAADYHLALRLQADTVPIFAPKNGFVYHTKKNWLDHSTTAKTKIYVGERTSEIRFEI